MKMNTTPFMKTAIGFFVILFCLQNTFAQVGIGTTSPAACSILDVTSTTQGFLPPRMTTAEKNSIASPVNGLMVFDTDLNAISCYNSSSSSWDVLNDMRNNYKRIKSNDVLATVLSDELAAGGGTKYLMNTNFLYEINGQVVFDFPIEMNNSYILGIDSGEDKIVKLSGDIFVGNTGGSLRALTIVASGGNVFNINGLGTQNLIFRDLIIANSQSVGVLDNFAFVFSSIVNYSGNTNGIVYKNTTKLLLSNQGWFGNNSGTYEKLEGTFGIIQKQGGFSEVVGANIGLDVSSNPTLSVDGTFNGVNFTGSPTTGKFVNGYTVGNYPGYNFNSKWDVHCSGIPFEGDAFTIGDVNFDYPIGFGYLTSLSATATKILGSTTSNNMNRASNGGADNRIQYLGVKKRYFTINAVGSFQATNGSNTTYVFYIVKNGSTIINQSKTYAFSTNAIDIRTFPIQCVVELAPNDYIEVFAQRINGTSDMLTVSLNLFMN